MTIFQRIANDPATSFRRSFLLLFTAIFIGGMIRTLTAVGYLLAYPKDTYDVFNIQEGDWVSFMMLQLILWIFPLVMSSIAFVIIVFVVHLMMQMMNGSAWLDQFTYLFAAYFAPLTMLRLALDLVPVLNLAIIFYIFLYLPFASFIAIKAVYHRNWRATLIGTMPIVFYVLFSAFVQV
jgi:hypothetical protein